MSATNFGLHDLRAAADLVHSSMPPTPQYAWPLLAERFGCTVVVKHENHTPTGAFQVRGGVVYIDQLKRERPQVKGIVSATRGKNLALALTFADGMAVRIPDADAVKLIAAGAEKIVTVSDDEVADAIRVYWTDTHNAAEGAGAAPLAAIGKDRTALAGKKVAAILCGQNIDRLLMLEVLAGRTPKVG